MIHAGLRAEFYFGTSVGIFLALAGLFFATHRPFLGGLDLVNGLVVVLIWWATRRGWIGK